MTTIHHIKTGILLWALTLLSIGAVQAQDELTRPYVLGSSGPGDMQSAVAKAKDALTANGFKVVGQYSPYATATVIGVTSDELLATAAKSDFGGYGAVIRVGITKNGSNIEVSYNNPLYMANAYRMASDLENISTKLKAALGAEHEFGSADGWKPKALRKYHYMMFMPYFDDQVALASHDSYDAAVKAVEAGLAAGKAGTAKVYRVDIPGKQETLFGVAMSEGDSGDEKIMKVVDVAEHKHTPHLPYDMLVSGNKVYSLHGKFRIAQSFPDLTMSTFMNISDSPDAIADALKAAAGGK